MRVKGIYAYKFFKRKTIAEEFARKMQGKVYKSDSVEYTLALESNEAYGFDTQGNEEIIKLFPYMVEWENPIGYFVVEWDDKDTWTTDFYRDKDSALAAAAERWRLMSDKAKSENYGFDVVRAITDDDASFYIGDVIEIVKSFNRGNHIEYPTVMQ